VTVAVQDDGCGFDKNVVMSLGRAGGWGLLGTQERASMLGGRLHVETAPGQGTLIEVTVPSPKEQVDDSD
jgi:signal transduction histidine kinase